MTYFSYFLMLWRTFEVMTYFQYFFGLWRTFWHDDVIVTSFYTLWRHTSFLTSWRNIDFIPYLFCIQYYTNIDFCGGEYVVICHSQNRRMDRACEVNTSFSGVTYNHVFTDTKSQYLFYYILPVKPLNIGSFIFISFICHTILI